MLVAEREPHTAAALLAVEDLVVSFPVEGGRLTAVNGVDLSVGAGESLGIVGESGSGKSVTALSILGLLRSGKVSGRVSFGGRNLLAASPRELRSIRGKEIAMVFQDPMSSLNPVQSVGRQISEVVEAHMGVSRREGLARAAELLELVGIAGAKSYLGDLPHQFSGGMRQRVMIAMAVSCNPKLLIADEPTTALDVTTQAQVLALLQRLRHELGMALIIITHDFGVVEEVAERVSVMYAGAVVESGDLERVSTRPRHPYTQGLLRSVPRLDAVRPRRLGFIKGSPPDPLELPPGCPFAPRCDFVMDVCRAEAPPVRGEAGDLSRCWLEQPVQPSLVPEPAAEAVEAEASGTGDAPLLEVEHLRIEYSRGWSLGSRKRKVLAVDDVSFSIRNGETLGLVGETGSGKSSIGRAILKLAPISSGDIAVHGRSVVGMRARQLREVAKSVKIVFQDPVASLDPRMTVAELVEEPLRIHHAGDRAVRRARVREVLHLVRLGDSFLGRYPHELSGGQRQRVGVARALVLSPELIICDEPVSSLDVSVQAQVVNLFHDLKDTLGLTYLFISHDLRVVRQLADRIAVMYRGRIVELSPTDELFERPKHPYTQLLLASIPKSPFRLVGAKKETPGGQWPQGDAEPGCVFAWRCPFATDRCIEERPPLEGAGEVSEVACHHWQGIAGGLEEPLAVEVRR